MIEGGIFKSILWFSIPLLIGNFFQQLYNTVDSYVVGNFVNTNALAAVGASTPVINMLVGFFMGLSAGAGVVISQYFGGKQKEEMSRAVHSSVALTALLSIVFTGAGMVLTKPLLRAIGVPEEVLPHSSLYLLIYFGGITFSLFYNMGAGILRAVGDSKHPLIYLAVASLVNIALDFLFVCGFHMGIAGVAIATIIAQAVSSAMVLYKLMHTQEDYRIELRKVRFHKKMVRRIVSLGFPAALQQSITSFSNVVVQSYINFFGAAAMAGYSAMLRIDGFLQLPLQSFNMAITTFVGQNIGARKYKRVKKGIWASWAMCSLVILVGSVCMYFFASFLISIFTDDAQVIANGSGMLRIFSTAYIILPVIQILNGALRGAGLSKIPMFFMLGCFVVLRQIYLMIAAPMTHNMFVVLTGWPVTWVICAIGMLIYYVKADWLPKEAEEQGR
ncbi:MATE family efflux transporter [Enterocloster citroniae]|uniref:MATE family efflux transporter n=1 Tax=Enterocloster citroniae TaxID=358743 RepID=UPI00349E7AB8